MKVLIFDIKSSIGHLKKPDSTATHLTYPFITRTAIRGMVGSILGMEEFEGTAWIGIQLLNPVMTSSQELSLLGKRFLSGRGTEFNRQTAVELVVNPHYRIFYCGDHYDELKKNLIQSKSIYHTYMGSAFALTFPKFVGEIDGEEEASDYVTCITVVPTAIVDELLLEEGMQYGRAGGIQYEYLSNRKFSGTINIIYEVAGKPIRFKRTKKYTEKFDIKLFKYKNSECICLW